MGYMFQVEYKKDWENFLADALSRVEERQQDKPATLFMLSFPHPTRLDELQQDFPCDPDLKKNYYSTIPIVVGHHK